VIPIIAMGIECKSYRSAARILGCSDRTVVSAVKHNRRSIKGKAFWFSGEEPAKAIKGRLGRPGRHCIIDGIEYDSIGDAVKKLGFNKRSLRAALDMRDHYKGHSVNWVYEEE
jgi:NUMOD1 domain